jgi:hypothetical protein
VARPTGVTLQIVRRLFAETEHGVVADLLEQQCGVNLPLTGIWGEAQFERLWFAVLKLSEGDITKLREAVRIAQIDWRDVLVAAGFGRSLEAHRQWARQLMS